MIPMLFLVKVQKVFKLKLKIIYLQKYKINENNIYSNLLIVSLRKIYRGAKRCLLLISLALLK